MENPTSPRRALGVVAAALLAAAPIQAQQAVQTAQRAVQRATEQTAQQPAPQAAPVQPQGTSADPTQDTVRTHKVKPGDTLWDLARAYLSDPHLWPAIYKINTDVVRDPHWIYPKETLRIPGAGQYDSTAVDSTSSDSTAADSTDAAEPDSADVERGRGAQSSSSGDGKAYGGVVGATEPGAVREGEVIAAPWIDRRGGPKDAGQIIGVADMPGIVGATERPRIQLFDRIYVTLPQDADVQAGDRYVVYAYGPAFVDDGQAMLPTGIVEVERVGKGDREATTVRVTRLFAPMQPEQHLVPLRRFSIPSRRPSSRDFDRDLDRGRERDRGRDRDRDSDRDVEAHVTWVPSGAVLPSVAHYVMLDATSRDGVEIGDQFTLFRPSARSESGVVLPEEPIALVEVVRVTNRGTTAIVVDQRHPTIKEGVRARLTAKAR